MGGGRTIWEELRSLSTDTSDGPDPRGIVAEVMGWEVNFQPVKIAMKDGSTVSGTVNIRGFKSIPEFLNAARDEFFAVVPDAPGNSRSVVMLNKNQILYVETPQ